MVRKKADDYLIENIHHDKNCGVSFDLEFEGLRKEREPANSGQP